MNATESSNKGLLITKPDARPIRNNSPRTVSRPDWILYSVPASAFVIGIFVFTFICKTQRPKTHPKQRTFINAQVGNYNSFRHSTDGLQNININKKDDTQSYENVEAAIYTNQDKVTYYVSADQDYITPDEIKEGVETHQDTLQLPQNLTDTDGESYENMASLYAEPRKCSQRHPTEQEEDYINPDDDGQQNLTHTDTESYEMMADPTCQYDNTDDSYEQMNGIPFQ
ncbi:uncharacterized protein [Misgurnus anguillicaudatus]|uniref:uncharacterized protein n=1 Tax=Misgurnus anguillicaudatus TaxID=75329 RepID=UPI003CCF9FDC